MNDSGRMRGREPFADLTKDRKDLPDGEGSAFESLFEGFARTVSQRDERLRVPLAYLVNRRNVGMVEGARRLRLALEPPYGVSSGSRAGEKLQRNLAFQADVFREINHSHAASAQ